MIVKTKEKKSWKQIKREKKLKQIAVYTGLLGLVVLGSRALVPSLITFCYNALIAIIPWLIPGAILAWVWWLIYQSEELYGMIFGVIAAIGFFAGGFWYESYGNFMFAKNNIQTEIIQQIPETVPESFRDITPGIAKQIVNANTRSSLYNYSTQVPAFIGGEDSYFVQKTPKKWKQKTSDKEFEVYKINSAKAKGKKPLELVFETNYALKGGWFVTDLGYVLQHMKPLSNIKKDDARYVINPQTKKGALVVPVEGINWAGPFRNWTWKGNFFIEDNKITYLTKDEIETSDYANLHVVPDIWVNQVGDLYRFVNADSWWGIQFGSDIDFTASNEEADHILSEIGDASPIYIEFEGISTKTDKVLYLTGSGIKEFQTEEQFSPDVFGPKVDSILATNNGLLVKLTNTAAVSIATWEKSTFLPVVQNNEVWFVYFIYSSSDETARRGLVALNSSNPAIAEGQEIKTADPEQFIYFENVAEVEAWLADNTLPAYTKQGESPKQPGGFKLPVLNKTTGFDNKELKEIKANQELILQKLKNIEEQLAQ